MSENSQRSVFSITRGVFSKMDNWDQKILSCALKTINGFTSAISQYFKQNYKETFTEIQ